MDVYCGVRAACTQAAGMPVIVYGDFAVSPGPKDMAWTDFPRPQSWRHVHLDYSVVIEGYRSTTSPTRCR